MRGAADLIHPYGMRLTELNDSSDVDAVVFRADIDIYKTVSVIAVDRYDDDGNLIGSIYMTQPRTFAR